MELKKLLRAQWPFLVSIPAYTLQVFFLFIPLLFILAYSMRSMENGGLLWLGNYTALFTVTYGSVLWNSCLLAMVTGFLCLLVAYPVAFYLAIRAKRLKNTLLIFLILPSWTSFIIQTYSWFYLLQKRGVFSTFLYSMGWTSEPVSFLNNYAATVFGMVYCYLPFMVFPIYTVLAKMDKRLLEASADLGASRWQTFRRIVLPLSWSGIRVGMFLVMVPAFGEFAIPDMMGGFKDIYVGRAIMEKFLIYRDWYSGAAIVMVAIVIPFLITLAMSMIASVRRHWHNAEEDADAV